MPHIKLVLLLITSVITSACSTLTKDPWGWLDQPEEQSWRPVRILAVGREIEFLVPDRQTKGGNRTQYWPESSLTGKGFETALSIERVGLPFTMVATFTWDSWWGGFYKKGGEDFYLSVGVFNLEGEENLLDLSIDERIERIRNKWLKRFSGPARSSNSFRVRFSNYFEVEPFKTDSGLQFVRHNAPRLSQEHLRYTIPLSDHHYLDFNFYVSELRFDREEDPQWNQSRWELVEQIMKTVRITPDPFGDQPEEVPAR